MSGWEEKGAGVLGRLPIDQQAVLSARLYAPCLVPSVMLKAHGEAGERNHIITNYHTQNTTFLFLYGNYSVGVDGGNKYIRVSQPKRVTEIIAFLMENNYS